MHISGASPGGVREAEPIDQGFLAGEHLGDMLPNSGPCLKPWPEPPPAMNNRLLSGRQSIMKSPESVFSY